MYYSIKEGDPFLTPFNFYPIKGPPLAFNPAIFNEPFNGRYLYNVLGYLLTFTRKANRDRYI